jgi:itaconyl-CoA hydratase
VTAVWFEDFEVGDRFRHFRGKTITDFETHTLSQLVMNTSEGHFNDEVMRDSPFGSVVTFGGIVVATVVGLASQDTAAEAVEEIGIDRISLIAPTRTGDTIYAETEVLETEGDPGLGSGTVRFLHLGVNGRGEAVCEIDRRVRIRRRGGS